MAELEKRWDLQCAKLLDHKRKSGNCVVPRDCKHDKPLGSGIDEQRSNHTNNDTRQDQKDLLDKAGIIWSVEDASPVDSEACKAGRTLKRQHEHCVAPIRHEEDVSLGVWVRTQRAFCTNHEMRQAQKDTSSNELGLVWRARSFFVPDGTLEAKPQVEVDS